LDDLDNGGAKTAGDSGNELKQDYFDHLVG